MNELDRRRYSRHIILDNIGEEGQEKLFKAKVLIIGFGGLGTGVAMYLTRMGVGHLGIVDKDEVDISNLQRQILYDEKDVGVSKIKSGVSKLKKINHEIIIDEYEFMLTDENADELVKKYDIVVDCTDNFKARGIINRACVKNKKTCVFGGVNEFNGFVQTYKDDSACYGCLMGNYEKLQEMDDSKKIVGVFGAMVGLISSMQALEVAKILLGLGKPITNKMIVIDGCDLSTSIIEIQKNKNCCCNKES